jgi:hypothetical protein
MKSFDVRKPVVARFARTTGYPTRRLQRRSPAPSRPRISCCRAACETSGACSRLFVLTNRKNVQTPAPLRGWDARPLRPRVSSLPQRHARAVPPRSGLPGASRPCRRTRGSHAAEPPTRSRSGIRAGPAACNSQPSEAMSKHMNANPSFYKTGGRELAEHHGETIPHEQEKPISTHLHGVKMQGKEGQPNFIPGQTPVGQPGRTRSTRKR